MSDFPSGRLEGSEREGRFGEERRGGVFIEGGGRREEEERGLTGSGIACWSEDSHSEGPSFLHKHSLAPSWDFWDCENHLAPLLAFWAFDNAKSQEGILQAICQSSTWSCAKIA